MTYGTLAVFDTLGARKVAAGDIIGLYDPNMIFESVKIYIDAHNNLMNMMEMELFETTEERIYTWGNVATVSMMKADEYSRPRAQKTSIDPVEGGLPLEKYQAIWQVTDEYMQAKTMQELDDLIKGVVDADVTNRLAIIRETLFKPTNNLTYKDHSTDNYTLKLRAFVNADSAYIPNNKFGKTFDSSTHTHFLGTGSYVAADLKGLITTVQEHYPHLPPNIRVYINEANQTTVEGFTGYFGFKPSNVVYGADTAYAVGDLDQSNTSDRPIGIFGPATVWAKAWMPANYHFCFHPNAPKPLKRRIRKGGQRGNLRIAAQYPLYPLFAEMMEREEGFGIEERTNGAALKLDNATYSAPSAWTF